MAIAGCGRPTTEETPAQLQNGDAVAAAAPVATPTPTPTPDPLQKYRAIQEVPVWAQRRVINDVPIKPGQKLFALTFDDGPWPESTEEILHILDSYDAKATFYMVGQMVRTYPKIARKVRDGGHSIGNHSWSHPSRPRNAVAEVQKTDAEIKKAVGVLPSSFRPPYGMLKNGLARQANREKMPVIIWSADSNDWRRPSAQTIANTVIRQAHPGGIALMHDGGGPRQNTVNALPTIIRELQARGYRLVTVPELLKARYIAPPKPKKQTAPKAKTAPKKKITAP
nr:peptidoglycan N-acetylglucosamine deacetylase [uncultured bacterium]